MWLFFNAWPFFIFCQTSSWRTLQPLPPWPLLRLLHRPLPLPPWLLSHVLKRRRPTLSSPHLPFLLLHHHLLLLQPVTLRETAGEVEGEEPAGQDWPKRCCRLTPSRRSRRSSTASRTLASCVSSIRRLQPCTRRLLCLEVAAQHKHIRTLHLQIYCKQPETVAWMLRKCWNWPKKFKPNWQG